MEQDHPTIPPITDEEVAAVLYEARGDAREAIRMLLHDLAALAQDADRLVSYGYARGRAPWRKIG
jgi:DNA polymerase III delta prime subunit